VARAAWFEPRRLVVRRRTIAPSQWPSAFDGLSLAVISDLHSGAPHVDADRVGDVVARVNRERADIALLLGDFVDPEVHGARPVTPEAVAERLRGLDARLGSFAVLGNHDWRNDGERIAAALRRVDIPVLEDDAVELRVRGRPLWIAGVADLREREPDVAATLAPIPAADPVILLSHDPDLFPRVPARVALTLSGHTHGGQVDVPGLRDVVVPSRFGGRFRAGHIVEGGRHLYVTSGIGTSGWPIRLRRPPEVVVLTLRAALR
jgi:predicted MPP superfamily phosphohydrolase